MIESILHIDQWLFTWINQYLSHSVLDMIMPILRNKLTWIPAYVVLVFIIIRSYKYNSIYIFIVIGLVIAVADVSSSQFIKKWIMRPRPCQETALSVRLLINCGSGFSFTSSHATNPFAVATILFLQFRHILSRWIKILLFTWAIIIGYAQIYVGVHYPFDVISGFLLGGIIAYVCYWLFYQLFPSLKQKIIS